MHTLHAFFYTTIKHPYIWLMFKAMAFGLSVKSIPFLLACCLMACSENKNETSSGTSEAVSNLRLEAKGSKENFTCGDTVSISVSQTKGSTEKVMLEIKIDGLPVLSASTSLPAHFTWHTDTAMVGSHEIWVETTDANHKNESKTLGLYLASDVVPAQYTYTVLKTFPHDIHSYTQGLVFVDGILYEGTGGYEQSKLRREELTSGKALQEISLSPSFFGEGLTYFDAHLYQLTWKSGTGFIYDKDDLKKTGQFSYGTEGWGLTTDHTRLIMSDGSSNLYFYDKKFSLLGKLQVCDTQGPVERLNELEYIDGMVYANVYQTNRIVIINPKNGKVLGSADLSGILPKSDYTSDTDVLNGIAYESASKKLYVTGKNWPKLFEIRLNRASDHRSETNTHL
jgi:glutamine cyclotransferase